MDQEQTKNTQEMRDAARRNIQIVEQNDAQTQEAHRQAEQERSVGLER
jgi:hypothetical protein